MTGDQIVYTAHGNIPRHVSKPTGVITDDKGNILILDRDNKRLVVYGDKGEFIRVMDVSGFQIPSNVQTIRKIGDEYYICDRGRLEENSNDVPFPTLYCRGSVGQIGGIYKFSLSHQD